MSQERGARSGDGSCPTLFFTQPPGSLLPHCPSVGSVLFWKNRLAVRPCRFGIVPFGTTGNIPCIPLKIRSLQSEKNEISAREHLKLRMYTTISQGRGCVPMLLQRVNRCPYCDRENRISSDSYRENPYCGECANERLERAIAAIGPVVSRQVSDRYVEVIPVTQTMPSNG